MYFCKYFSYGIPVLNLKKNICTVIILFTAGRGKEMRQVCSGHDTFLLIASSAVDMEQWIGVINRIIYAVSFTRYCINYITHLFCLHTVDIVLVLLLSLASHLQL